MRSLLLLFLSILLLSSIKTYAKVCPKGTYLVKGHPRQAYYRSDGIYVSNTAVSSYCKNYRNDGPLKSEFKIRMPRGWPHRKESFKKCPKKSLKKIQKSLAEFPKILTNVGSLRIYCADRSIYPSNPASSAPANKIIVLYESSFSGDLKRYIAHELAHILYERLSDKEKEDYRKVGLWKLDENGNIYTSRKIFSEPDGANGPDEDFSNNVEHYLFNKNDFNKKFPSVFKWIEDLFGDKK